MTGPCPLQGVATREHLYPLLRLVAQRHLERHRFVGLNFDIGDAALLAPLPHRPE